MTDKPDKRMASRKRKRLKVRFGSEESMQVAFSDDISETGLFLTTAKPEKPGTILTIEIDIPDGETVKCQGQVRWARKVPLNMLRGTTKGGMGIKLGNFKQGQEAYRQMVEELRY